MYMCSLFPKEALDIMLDYYHPTSILDVGCGTGVSLDYFKTKKIDVLGIEGSKLAISKANNPNLIIQHNLNKPLALKQTFDVVWCFEVIEHIHPKYENNIIHILINHSDNIVLSAAQPGQGGHGHFNEKPLKYWIDKFENLNFIYLEKLSEDMRRTKDINAKNLLAFSKRR